MANATAKVEVDTTEAQRDIAAVKMQALEAENAALRAQVEVRAASLPVAGKLLKWTPPRYRYFVSNLNGLSLGQQLEKELPEGCEVFAIPSERVIVYRQVIDEPEEAPEAR